MADKPSVGAYVKNQDANAAIADIPKNRTILVTKLTSDQALGPRIVTDLTNPEQVFDHFKPKVEVGFENEEGGEVKEELAFNNLGDFGRKGITAQSAFLKNLDAQKENYNKFLKQLKSNKILQKMLTDGDSKTAYVAALKTMLTELEGGDS